MLTWVNMGRCKRDSYLFSRLHLLRFRGRNVCRPECVPLELPWPDAVIERKMNGRAAGRQPRTRYMIRSEFCQQKRAKRSPAGIEPPERRTPRMLGSRPSNLALCAGLSLLARD